MNLLRRRSLTLTSGPFDSLIGTAAVMSSTTTVTSPAAEEPAPGTGSGLTDVAPVGPVADSAGFAVDVGSARFINKKSWHY